MPSKKQRRRREKERRHEYELVLIDETGEERPIDSAELRAERREREAARTKQPAGKDGKRTAGKSRSGRPIREVQPPAWNRVWKRTAFLGVFMFLVLTFVGGKHKSWGNVVVPTVLYTALFAPFLYLLDRTQYNQYLKRTGQQAPPRGSTDRKRPTEEPADGEGKGPAASIRRALRR